VREILLQKEDFSDFIVDDFPYDPEHSAMGEYHYYPPKGYQGNWYCPITDSSMRGPMWMIVEENGRKAIESQVLHRQRPSVWNMIVTGCDDWKDYQVEVEIRMLNTSLLCGLAFRYQNSRCFYALCFEEQKVKLIKRNHEEYTELVSKNFEYNCDKVYKVRVICEDRYFKAYIDEQHIFDAKDSTFKNGKIALFANAPVQFYNILVHTSKEAYSKLLIKRQKDEQELKELREKYPQPKLWKVLDLKDFGAGRSIRFGDLTGNGQYDILLAQCQKRVFKDRYANISCLTAIDLDGNILWQIGEPNPNNAFITADLPFQIVDIDMDGKNEVVVAKDFKLMILEGSTGKVKKSIDTPISDDPVETLYAGVPFGRYAFDRVNVDCIRICNFSGKKKPTDILIKDRYSRVWVYDNELNFLWKYHDGITGHFPYTKDINNDEREEMMVGYNLVDADGNKIWTLPIYTDHVDEIIIGKLNPDFDEDIIALACGDEGFVLCDLRGNIIKKELIGHVQRISAGKFRPELEGLQIAVTTYWGNQGIIYLYSCKGEMLYSFEPGTNGNMITPVNWTGDGQDLILLNGNVEKGGMIDGYGRRVVVFPDDGHPDLCAEAIDLTGDCRDEIVLWDSKKMFIYTQDRKFVGTKIYNPYKYPTYNASNYRGEYSWPRWVDVRSSDLD
jgi:hypothetical protein